MQAKVKVRFGERNLASKSGQEFFSTLSEVLCKWYLAIYFDILELITSKMHATVTKLSLGFTKQWYASKAYTDVMCLSVSHKLVFNING